MDSKTCEQFCHILKLAVGEKNISVVKFLIENKITDVNCIVNNHGYYKMYRAIIFSIENNYSIILDFIKNKKLRIKEESKIALYYKDLKKIKSLIKEGYIDWKFDNYDLLKSYLNLSLEELQKNKYGDNEYILLIKFLIKNKFMITRCFLFLIKTALENNKVLFLKYLMQDMGNVDTIYKNRCLCYLIKYALSTENFSYIKTMKEANITL